MFTSLAKQFPNSRYHPEFNLRTWHPTGILDNERADRIIEFLEDEEKYGDRSFHRFTDMTGYSRLQIGLDHIVRLARRRKRKYRGGRVKSAFYAVRLLSVNIASMYEELMQGSKIEVRTFRERGAAADWLGVPLEILQRPKTKTL